MSALPPVLLQSLAGTVRHKAYRKRVLSRDVHWSLGTGFEIAVALYAMVHTAVKGAYTYVKAQNNEPSYAMTQVILVRISPPFMLSTDDSG